MPLFSWFSLIMFLGIIQGIIMAFLLFIKKGKSNLFLSLLVLNLSLDLLGTLLGEGGWYDRYSTLYFLPIFYNLAYGPLIYFYTLFLLRPDFKLVGFRLLHFLPVILQGSFYWTVFWFNLPAKGHVYRAFYDIYFRPLKYYGTICSIGIYLSISFYYLSGFKLNSTISSFPHIKQLRLIKALLISFTVLFVLWLGTKPMLSFLGVQSKFDIFYIFMAVFVYGIGFMSLSYPNPVKDLTFEPQENQIDSAQVLSKRTALLTSQQTDEFINRINHLLVNEQIYKNPDLNLQQLADHLNTNIKIASYVINAGMEMTFTHLINTCRVKEAQYQIENPDNDHLTLLGIGYNSGFNSKSSFNLIFKQYTGMTPKEFKLNIRQTASLIKA